MDFPGHEEAKDCNHYVSGYCNQKGLLDTYLMAEGVVEDSSWECYELSDQESYDEAVGGESKRCPIILGMRKLASNW